LSFEHTDKSRINLKLLPTNPSFSLIPPSTGYKIEITFSIINWSRTRLLPQDQGREPSNAATGTETTIRHDLDKFRARLSLDTNEILAELEGKYKHAEKKLQIKRKKLGKLKKKHRAIQESSRTKTKKQVPEQMKQAKKIQSRSEIVTSKTGRLEINSSEGSK
jgi:hypothetical protein